jgi:hypothetical protein
MRRTKIVPGVNDYATTHPHLAAELTDQTLATKISYASGKLVEYICRYGHTYKTKPTSRHYHNVGCTVCGHNGYTINIIAGHHPTRRRNTPTTPTTFISHHPAITGYGEDDETTLATITIPNDLYASHIIRALNNHWKQTGSTQTIRNLNLNPAAGGTTIDELTTLINNIATYLRRGIYGATPATGHHECPLGHTRSNNYYPKASELANRPNLLHAGCPECNHKKTLPGFNTLNNTHPWIARIPNLGVDPTAHMYARGRVIPGYNDLGTVRPDIAAELVNPNDATKYTIASGARVPFKCLHNPEHRTWDAYIHNRTFNGTGCPECASENTRRLGYNAATQTATFYIHAIHNNGEHVAYKYGKTTVTLEGRARKQQAAAAPGITVHPVYKLESNPYLISKVEYSIRQILKGLQTTPTLTRNEFEDGHTETISPDTNIKKLIEHAEATLAELTVPNTQPPVAA